MSSIIVPNGNGSSDSIWLPGKGEVPIHTRQVADMIREYDPRLTLGRNTANGDWVVLRDGGPEDVPLFPVIGFGPDLPSADKVKAELYKRDVSRNGKEIVESIVKRQNQRRAASRSRADAGAEEAGEAMAWAHKQMGDIRAPLKVHIPGRD